jgi:hypothetical protein
LRSWRGGLRPRKRATWGTAKCGNPITASRPSRLRLGPVYIHFVQRTVATRLMLAAICRSSRSAWQASKGFYAAEEVFDEMPSPVRTAFEVGDKSLRPADGHAASSSRGLHVGGARDLLPQRSAARSVAPHGAHFRQARSIMPTFLTPHQYSTPALARGAFRMPRWSWLDGATSPAGRAMITLLRSRRSMQVVVRSPVQSLFAQSPRPITRQIPDRRAPRSNRSVSVRSRLADSDPRRHGS